MSMNLSRPFTMYMTLPYISILAMTVRTSLRNLFWDGPVKETIN